MLICIPKRMPIIILKFRDIRLRLPRYPKAARMRLRHTISALRSNAQEVHISILTVLRKAVGSKSMVMVLVKPNVPTVSIALIYGLNYIMFLTLYQHS